MTETLILCLEFGPLESICYLACLREAASAKAGACNLVLQLRHRPIFVTGKKIHTLLN